MVPSRSDGLDEFFDLLALAASPMRPPAGSRLAVLTVSGGPSVLAADEAERLGLVLPALADSTLKALKAVVPSFAATRNPVDLTPQCPPEACGPAVDALYDDPRLDGVVVIDCGLDIAEFGDAVIAACKRTGKPTVAFITEAPAVARALSSARIPLLPSPERAMKAYASLVRHPSTAASPNSRGPIRVSKRPATLGGMPPEDQGLTVLSEWESKQRLTGLPLVPERRTTSLAEAAAAVAELRAPLVAKASGIAHKSERGLVRLGQSPEEILDAWQELADAGDGSVLIAEYVEGELELIVGGLRDPHFGPTITIGLGGKQQRCSTTLSPSSPHPIPVRSNPQSRLYAAPHSSSAIEAPSP